MKRKALAMTATALVSVLALTACGGESKSNANPSSSATTAAASDADVSADLLKQVEGLVDADQTPAEHAAAVEGGDDLEPTFTKLAKYLSEGPAVTFKIQNPQVTGETAKADVQILSGGSAVDGLFPAFFQQVDGAWKITRTGACSLIAVSGITCPEVAS